MNGYFIADDAHDVPTVWHASRWDDPTPRPVINMFDLRHDPRLWDAIVATVAALDTAADPDTPTPTRCRHGFDSAVGCQHEDCWPVVGKAIETRPWTRWERA